MRSGVKLGRMVESLKAGKRHRRLSVSTESSDKETEEGVGKVARSKGTLFQSGTFSINCFKVCSPSDQSNLSQPESQKKWIPTLCDLEYGTLPPWVSFSLSVNENFGSIFSKVISTKNIL